MVRDLDWEGCVNVRDLGALRTAGDGALTVSGAMVRADSLHKLTERGWGALLDHGVRTVIDLRNEDEVLAAPDIAPRPPGLTTLALALDNLADTEFWAGQWSDGPQFATPLYYRPHLERMPERSARVLAAIAPAEIDALLAWPQLGPRCAAGASRSAIARRCAPGFWPEDRPAGRSIGASRLRWGSFVALFGAH